MTRESMLDTLPQDRARAVAVFLDSSVGDCPDCGRPVTFSQPRALRKDVGVHHLDCTTAGPAG